MRPPEAKRYCIVRLVHRMFSTIWPPTNQEESNHIKTRRMSHRITSRVTTLVSWCENFNHYRSIIDHNIPDPIYRLALFCRRVPFLVCMFVQWWSACARSSSRWLLKPFQFAWVKFVNVLLVACTFVMWRWSLMIIEICYTFTRVMLVSLKVVVIALVTEVMLVEVLL